MKKLFFVLALVAGISVQQAEASFPVIKKEAKTEIQATPSQIQAAEQLGNDELTKKQERKEFKKAVKGIKKIVKENKGRYDKTIALILCIFLGGLAAHRWYAGKPVGLSILFILTAGGCGVWWIIDLINILTDNF